MIINEYLDIFHWKTGQKYWEKLQIGQLQVQSDNIN